MGDDNNRSAALVVEPLERLGQSGERPEIDTGFRLVEEHEARVFGKNRRDLDALDLATGKARIDIAVQIISGAKADLRQIRTCLVVPERFARRNVQKVRDADTLEARRLLKAVGNAASGAVGDRKGRDVFAVPDNLAFGGRNKAHDRLGERRFAAAVGARDDDELSILDGQIDMLENVYRPAFGRRGEA